MKCVDTNKREEGGIIINRKTLVVLVLLELVILVGVPESLAHPQYLAPLSEMYGDGSCGTCHVTASGGGPRNSYGTLFENQPNHITDPGAALTTIGRPPTATGTPTFTPVPTLTPTATSAETTTSAATTTATGNPAASGFGFILFMVGLFTCALLARWRNK
jgi:hypothetical protein